MIQVSIAKEEIKKVERKDAIGTYLRILYVWYHMVWLNRASSKRGNAVPDTAEQSVKAIWDTFKSACAYIKGGTFGTLRKPHFWLVIHTTDGDQMIIDFDPLAMPNGSVRRWPIFVWKSLDPQWFALFKEYKEGEAPPRMTYILGSESYTKERRVFNCAMWRKLAKSEEEIVAFLQTIAGTEIEPNLAGTGFRTYLATA